MADRRRPAWRPAWAGGVRARTTLAATLVVAMALLVGAVVLVALMRDILVREVEAVARLRATEVAAQLASGGGPPTVATDEEEHLFQVLDATGSVVASSSSLSGRPAMAALVAGESAEVEPLPDEGPFVAVAAGAATPDGTVIVIVARGLDDVLEATQVVSGLLAIGLPVLLALVAATTWWVVGGALAPVERIRSEVDAISAAELHRRVPQPAATDEIGRLAATMNRMLERLDRSQLRQRRFVSDASHELRSPIASIRQHAEVALAHPEATDVRELAGTALAEDLRLQRLVDDLLLLARADEQTLELRRAPVDLDDLVFAEATRLRDATRLHIDTAGVSAARVDGDAASLSRVLRNLGENAARHARERIALSLAQADGGGTVVLAVDDDGPGISAAERERVFERFVRLDDARARDGGGSGLGLAIVAELVAAHGGSVAVAESDLGGARVEVRLPA
jgi:signal transduction histidine kinase